MTEDKINLELCHRNFFLFFCTFVLLILAVSPRHLFGWEWNIHLQLIRDAYTLLPEEDQAFYDVYNNDILRFFDQPELLHSRLPDGYPKISSKSLRKEIDTRYSKLIGKRSGGALDLYVLAHLVADYFCPPDHWNCDAVDIDFYLNLDINAFIIGGDPSLPSFLDAYGRFPYHTLITKDATVSYVFSLNALYRLFRAYHVSRADKAVQWSPAALYRVNFTRQGGGPGQRHSSTYYFDYDIWGNLSSITHSNSVWTRGMGTPNVHLLSQCTVKILCISTYPSDGTTFLMMNIHSNQPSKVEGLSFSINKSDYFLPLTLDGFSDTIVFFSCPGNISPKDFKMTLARSDQAKTLTLYRVISQKHDSILLTGATEELTNLREKAASDILKEACSRTKAQSIKPPSIKAKDINVPRKKGVELFVDKGNYAYKRMTKDDVARRQEEINRILRSPRGKRENRKALERERKYLNDVRRYITNNDLCDQHDWAFCSEMNKLEKKLKAYEDSLRPGSNP